MTLATEHLTLDDLFDTADLAAAIDAGYVTRKQHPTLPLSILTYTSVCQYGHIWTPVTMQCRGLIAEDTTGRIVALPFPKIFVTGMHGNHDFAPALPAGESFEIFEKVDGSLIILYWYAGQWHAASKGSFISEQAQWAQAWIDKRGADGLDPQVTYLAEAIYPGNRIVVDYRGRQDLVYLGGYLRDTGGELDFHDGAEDWTRVGLGGVARYWGLGDDISELENDAIHNIGGLGVAVGGIEEEGHVIRFTSGQRAKIKLSAYLTLHKLYTGTNERTVWEALAAGQDLGSLFDRVPDEFRDWVEQIAEELRAQQDRLVDAAVEEYERIVDSLPPGFDRKPFAIAAQKAEHKSAMFLLLDGHSDAFGAWAWKQIKPRGDAPFKSNDEG